MGTSFLQAFSERLRPRLAGCLRLVGGLARGVLKVCLALCALALVSLLYYFWPAVTVRWAQWQEGRRLEKIEPAQLEKGAKRLQAEITALREERAKLQQAAVERQPAGPYIVIDTNTNTYLMREGDKVLREGICSTGSGKRLTWVKGRKTWVFDTPKGRHKVRVKKDNFPIWTRPDWDYVEQGEKVPSPSDTSRFVEGMLGEYALDFGDGYMIHGTPFKRFLGMKVSHGCVRLDDPDIEYLYNLSQKGTEVYIY